MLFWTALKLKSKDEEERKQAVEKLDNSSNMRAIKYLISALKDESDEVRKNACNALIKKGSSSVKPLIRVLNHENHEIRWEAAKALGSIGDIRAVDPLIKKINTNPDIGNIMALGAIGDPRAVDALAICLNNKGSSNSIREYAISALGEIGNDRAIELLYECLKKETFKEVKNMIGPNIVRALSKIGDSRVLKILINFITKDSRPSARYEYVGFALEEAIKGIANIGKASAVDPLLKALDKPDIKEALSDIIARELEKIMKKTSSEISEACLRKITGFQDHVHYRYTLWGNCGSSSESNTRVDWSCLKQMARQELIMRGLDA